MWLAGVVGVPGGARVPEANVADRCQWPTVVSFRAGEEKCTGTLVHPEIVITAAHCVLGGTPERMRFGEDFSPQARSMDVVECWARPEYAIDGDPAQDLAACRLVAPVADVPLTPLLGACETSHAITAGADVALVGFGIPYTGGDFGTKRYAFTRVVEASHDDGTFVAGDATVNGCDGDSGGPALVRLADGTWHVAGVLVWGPECGGGPSRYLSAAHHIEWLEDVTGRDVTQCRDDEGEWDPGPDCRAATDPLSVADAWVTWCEGPRVVPDDACVGSGEDSGTTVEPSQDESSTGDDRIAADLPRSSVGCRITAPRERLGDMAIGLLAIAGLAFVPRRRAVVTCAAPPRGAARSSRGRRARARAESRASRTRRAGSRGSSGRA